MKLSSSPSGVTLRLAPWVASLWLAASGCERDCEDKFESCVDDAKGQAAVDACIAQRDVCLGPEQVHGGDQGSPDADDAPSTTGTPEPAGTTGSHEPAETTEGGATGSDAGPTCPEPGPEPEPEPEPEPVGCEDVLDTCLQLAVSIDDIGRCEALWQHCMDPESCADPDQMCACPDEDTQYCVDKCLDE